MNARGSPSLTPVTVSKLETMDTLNINQTITLAAVFDLLHAKTPQSPYNVDVLTISVVDAYRQGYTLSDAETTSWGTTRKWLIAPDGRRVPLESRGSTTIVVRQASETKTGTIQNKDGSKKEFTINKGDIKGYVI